MRKNLKKTKNSRATRFSILTASILLLVLFISLANKSKAQFLNNPTVSFNPNSVTVQNNQIFSLDIQLDPGGNDVSAVQLYFSFDPTKVQLDALSGNSTLLPMEVSNTIDNNTGKALYAAGIRLSPRTPITSTSTIATLTFHSVAAGNNSINIDANSFATVLGAGSANVSATASVMEARTYSISDWQRVQSHWLQDVTGEENGDYNSDGKANTRDLGVIMHSWQ